MVDLLSIFAPIHVLLTGGTLQEALATQGGTGLVVTLLFVIPASLIAMGIGLTDWRETPLALWLGFGPKADEAAWVARATDLDGDGRPDF